jgi:type I restriction enzyme S subunit
VSFPAYPEYKDSGVSWAKSIPAHWNELRLAALFELQKRDVEPEHEVVTAFRNGQVTLRSNRREDGFTFATKEIGYQGVATGDLVIHAMDAFAGAIGVSEAAGKSTPVYSVCSPKPGVDARFYAMLLRTMALAGFVESLAKGVRERSTDFRWRDARDVRVPVPPYDEQRAVVAFLDRETAKIDAVVAAQERMPTRISSFCASTAAKFNPAVRGAT